jgi:secreted PhoX family phosphatase
MSHTAPEENKMGTLSRRGFVSALGTGAAGLTIAPLTQLHAQATSQGGASFGPGFGPLTPKLPLNSSELPEAFRGRELLSLPEGFDYTAVSITGQTMSDGNPVPGAHDGMAAFQGPRATTIVIRNHELTTSSSPVIVPGGNKYDNARAGGTSTLTFDRTGKLLKHVGSLAGTERNCAGGPTPWDAWLTCEETFSLAEQRHGYVFEVPMWGEADHVPLTGLGRFNHEAAAIDRATWDVYLTEDRGDSLFYRFRPDTCGDLRGPGVLEALRLKDFPNGVNTRSGFRDFKFQPFAAEWVTIDDPDPDTESGGNSTRAQGQAKGAAVFSRGEGAWYGNGKIYFVSTDGGNDRGGQVWAYDPAAETLTLFVEAVRDTTNPAYADNGGFLLAAPDNITVGPDGRLYLCEDGGGVEKVVGVSHSGELFEMARNIFNDSEFAGACFSHDGRFMFVNVQSPGLTYVIRGPWRKGGRS